MRSPHKYYVYYDGGRVFARMEKREPVLVREFATAQEAHDFVQKVVNPSGKAAREFGPKGFLEESFVQKISGNCEAIVVEAYRKGGR